MSINSVGIHPASKKGMHNSVCVTNTADLIFPPFCYFPPVLDTSFAQLNPKVQATTM